VKDFAGEFETRLTVLSTSRAGGEGRPRRWAERCRGVGRVEDRRHLDAFLDDLATAGFKAVEVEEEFVVHADRPGLDSGWIDERADAR
jgi:hypothetical protein